MQGKICTDKNDFDIPKTNGSLLLNGIRISRGFVSIVFSEAVKIPKNIYKGINESTLRSSGETVSQKLQCWSKSKIEKVLDRKK